MAAAELRLLEPGPLRYLLSLPEAPPAPRAAPLPVLCFLHGFDEAAPLEIRRGLTRHGPLRPDGWPGVLERFIVVAPQLPAAGDLWHRYADEVEHLVIHVHRTHGGDPQRTYLTGFSFGGNGVFDLAVLQPARWAALWAVDPTRVPTNPITRPVWLSIGEVARSRRAAFVRTLGLEDADASPRVAIGDRLYLDEGADHVRSAELAYRDRRIYEWLLTKRLPGAE